MVSSRQNICVTALQLHGIRWFVMLGSYYQELRRLDHVHNLNCAKGDDPVLEFFPF